MKNLNWKNVKPMMKQFHDDGDQDDYNDLWNSIYRLAAFEFDDMKALFKKMIKYEYDHESFNE